MQIKMTKKTRETYEKHMALVKRFIGNETHKKLRDSFKSYKIKYIVRNGK